MASYVVFRGGARDASGAIFERTGQCQLSAAGLVSEIRLIDVCNSVGMKTAGAEAVAQEQSCLQGRLEG